VLDEHPVVAGRRAPLPLFYKVLIANSAVVVLGVVALLGVAWSLYEFPRRDLAAPA